MPRVTQREQYKRHLFLRTIWSDPGKQACLAVLSATEQWKIHIFYRPSEELTLKQFRNHLHVVQRDHPQLGHVSGKLYRKVERAVAQQTQRAAEQLAPIQTRARARVPARHSIPIVVYGVVRPKPDLNKLLKALVEMAREEQDEDNRTKN